MPRPKEFDPDEVLEKAMRLFWEQGYEATSMDDLIKRTGVHRGSLYETFGNKEQIFLAAFDRFSSCVSAPFAQRLLESPTPLATLQAFFRENIVESYAQGMMQDGCMLANVAVEMAPHHKEVCCKVNQMLEARERVFHLALTRAQEQNELAQNKDVRSLAQYLNALALGIAVMIRANTDPEVVRAAVQEGLKVFEA